MDWTEHERPSDTLRLIAGLQIAPPDAETCELIGQILGLSSSDSMPQEDEPPPVASTDVPVDSEVSSWDRWRRFARDRPAMVGVALALTAAMLLAGLVLTELALVRAGHTGWAVAVGLVVVVVLATAVVLALRLMPFDLRSLFTPSEPQPTFLDTSTNLRQSIRDARLPDPLIDDRRVPAIAQALASAYTPSGQPDLAAAEQKIARGESALPLATARSRRLARRTLVLVDRSEAMAPLRHDGRALIAGLEKIVGTDRLTVLHFRSRPEDGMGEGAAYTWRPYEHRLGPPGTRILIISDAGVTAESVAEQRRRFKTWTGLARGWTSSGAMPLLLTPYPQERYPPAMSDTIAIARWHEATSAREIFASGRQHEL